MRQQSAVGRATGAPVDDRLERAVSGAALSATTRSDDQ